MVCGGREQGVRSVAIAESGCGESHGRERGGQRVWHFVGGPRLWSSRAAACAEAWRGSGWAKDAIAPSGRRQDRTPEMRNFVSLKKIMSKGPSCRRRFARVDVESSM